MIDVKQAIQIARTKAAEMLDEDSSNIEEIERDSYKGRDVWSITLSFPRRGSTMLQMTQPQFWWQYKRFLIDVETGDLAAVKLRELASA